MGSSFLTLLSDWEVGVAAISSGFCSDVRSLLTGGRAQRPTLSAGGAHEPEQTHLPSQGTVIRKGSFQLIAKGPRPKALEASLSTGRRGKYKVRSFIKWAARPS